MSLIRQVWLLLVLTLVLAFAGAFGVSLLSAHHNMEAQVTLKNNVSAQSMALMLSQLKGDTAAVEQALTSQLESGFYERIRLLNQDGRPLFDKQGHPQVDDAPAWFNAWLGIHPSVGVAPLTEAMKPAGQLEVSSDTRFAQMELWTSAWRTLLLLCCLVLVVGVLARLALGRIQRPLQATVEQALALTERRFITVSEPVVPELRNVTRAMNAMVERLKAMFDEQAGQVEHLRRQANCDLLTGVSNRAHFMSRLKTLLGAEDGSPGGALVLVRICDLQGVNRRIGRTRVDDLLKSSAAIILESARRAPNFETGRLNGSDFALILPDAGSLREPAVDVAARLRGALRERDPEAQAVVGAVRWWHGASVSSLLAAADHALARAESRGAFAVELDDAGEGVTLGEDAWRRRIEAALDANRVSLVEYPLVDARGEIVHHECPLRLQFEDGGAKVPAAQWLPMARRSQLTARIDLAAVDLSLKAMTEDGLARAVNISPGSLLDGGFVPKLCGLLALHAELAPGLWLELAEAGAWRHLPLVRELIQQLHAYGTRIGLEHAGEHLAHAGALLEAGLDFVKLDSSFTEGLANDSARSQHVAGTVRMLHGIGLKVYAEGVADKADAMALWDGAIDGLTGPVVVA